MADARRHSADQHFMGAWFVDLYIFDLKRFPHFAQYGRFHGFLPVYFRLCVAREPVRWENLGPGAREGQLEKDFTLGEAGR
ncbi:hypothetical protein M2A_0507 [Tepidicaulis marinus]|uniref:Uncharacterized protein n=1 Tax=Tepidicaulis marinus TaxID=1333998 RepID=A0A081B7J0_9HYPH|nr:hypothetical protein M2A_0507 [Tepidicaulis marinus]